MNATALIPARYAATRFPGKLMQSLGGLPVITRTYEATVATGLFDAVIVVTDSDEIESEIKQAGGKVMRSRQQHESGTDRIAEAAREIDAELIVNVQGDTPFVSKPALEILLKQFTEESVQVASLMQAIKSRDDIMDPNFVKVVIDKNSNALFFSRSVLPYPRDREYPTSYYEHIGVYAFRRQALLDFSQWRITPLEAAEKIECLRFLENGITLRMVLVDYMGVEIDTPEDLEKAKQLLS